MKSIEIYEFWMSFFTSKPCEVEDLAHEIGHKAKASEKEREERIKDAVQEAGAVNRKLFHLYFGRK